MLDVLCAEITQFLSDFIVGKRFFRKLDGPLILNASSSTALPFSDFYRSFVAPEGPSEEESIP